MELKPLAGMEVVKSVDQKYNVSGTTKSAAMYTGRLAASAASAVINSSYFSARALWVSDLWQFLLPLYLIISLACYGLLMVGIGLMWLALV